MARTATKPDDCNKLEVVQAEGKSEARALADVGIDPNAHAAITSQIFGKGTFGALPVTDTFKAVHEATGRVGKGDMSGPEQMLAAQAISLNAIFTEMARRSALNMGEYLKASEATCGWR